MVLLSRPKALPPDTAARGEALSVATSKLLTLCFTTALKLSLGLRSFSRLELLAVRENDSCGGWTWCHYQCFELQAGAPIPYMERDAEVNVPLAKSSFRMRADSDVESHPEFNLL
eukprot:scaffold4891_cov140-Cylindrotheca_fusiformis.AAC.18